MRQGQPLADVSAALGYYDQSHMTKAFGRWISLTSAVGIATPSLIAAGMTVVSSVAGVAFADAGLVSLGWLSLVFLGARSSLKGE